MKSRACLLDRRPRHWPDRGARQDSRHVPTALGPDHDVGIDAERDGFGVGRCIQDNFDIIEVGKCELAAMLELAKTKTDKEVQQPLLRMRINSPISLGAA